MGELIFFEKFILKIKFELAMYSFSNKIIDVLAIKRIKSDFFVRIIIIIKKTIMFKKYL